MPDIWIYSSAEQTDAIRYLTDGIRFSFLSERNLLSDRREGAKLPEESLFGRIDKFKQKNIDIVKFLCIIVYIHTKVQG